MVRITCCAPVMARGGKYGMEKCLRISYKDDFKARQQKYKVFYFNKTNQLLSFARSLILKRYGISPSSAQG